MGITSNVKYASISMMVGNKKRHSIVEFRLQYSFLLNESIDNEQGPFRLIVIT